MKLLILLALLLAANAHAGPAIHGGVTIADGRQDGTLLADYTQGKYSGEVGYINREGSGVRWTAIRRVIYMGEIDFRFGGGLIDGDDRFIRSGMNFVFGFRYNWGSMSASIDHISNGMKVFGHTRGPNRGENFITIGHRF